VIRGLYSPRSVQQRTHIPYGQNLLHSSMVDVT
jgi:hypothetical protein